MKKANVLRVFSRALVIAVVAGSSMSARAGIVVILEGHDPNPKTNTGIHEIADIAVANYTAKGYTIQRHANTAGPVAKATAIAAINKTGKNAIFYAGHGIPGSSSLALTNPPGGVPANQIIGPGDLTGDYSGIKHVEFQACGQNTAGWAAKFPGATLDAWNGSITVDQAKNDAKNGSPGRIPQKTPAGPGAAASKPGMGTAFLNQILTMPDAQSCGPGYMCGDWTQLGWQLQPPLGFALGNKTFNIRTRNGPDYLPLRGLTFSNGIVIDDVNGGYAATPDFILTLDWLAFDQAMQDPSLLPLLYLNGLATIDNNFTSVHPDLLFQGSAGVYFGYNAVPTPGTVALLAGAGLFAARRRRPNAAA